MLKKWIPLSLFIMSFMCVQATYADDHGYKKINAIKLKRWIDEEKECSIFDSRTAKYDDGFRLPNARLLPCDSSDEFIFAEIPSKDSLVVIYCSSASCKASLILSERLTELGYTRVYKYVGGLSDWKEKGYPIKGKK